VASLCDEKAVAAWEACGSPRRAFEAIVNKHMQDAYYIALGLVGNREDALELSQEAFYRAYKHFDQLKDAKKFFPWFYQILRNLCFSHLRKRRVRRAGSLDEMDGEPPDMRMGDCFDPEMIAERNEAKDRVWKAISQLDEKHREVIVLRHFRTLSYDEMAKVLFCNRGTVTSRLYYARKRLKDILDRESGSSDVASDDEELRKGGQS